MRAITARERTRTLLISASSSVVSLPTVLSTSRSEPYAQPRCYRRSRTPLLSHLPSQAPVRQVPRGGGSWEIPAEVPHVSPVAPRQRPFRGTGTDRSTIRPESVRRPFTHDVLAWSTRPLHGAPAPPHDGGRTSPRSNVWRGALISLPPACSFAVAFPATSARAVPEARRPTPIAKPRVSSRNNRGRTGQSRTQWQNHARSLPMVRHSVIGGVPGGGGALRARRGAVPPPPTTDPAEEEGLPAVRPAGDDRSWRVHAPPRSERRGGRSGGDVRGRRHWDAPPCLIRPEGPGLDHAGPSPLRAVGGNDRPQVSLDSQPQDRGCGTPSDVPRFSMLIDSDRLPGCCRGHGRLRRSGGDRRRRGSMRRWSSKSRTSGRGCATVRSGRRRRGGCGGSSSARQSLQ